MDLESDSIPRIHSFAWHTGIRAEPVEQLIDISTLLTSIDLQNLSKRYFEVVQPEFGLLDEAEFHDQAAVRFSNSRGINDVDAVLCGVAALGSFFSLDPHPREDDFVCCARNILVQKSVNHPTANNVAGMYL